ncbi:response regulator [Ramlibacter rhizophilus]|uniref:Response regulator n=1 Tax=Ramlibacter rhizophilus TaxID=1781167 RepID=A0A4Z0BJ22_9BURK|nr:response regulator transcription factor [Ramlibacter rhizophilus]TFY98761.1 response regulator [Ramlibacter rhizophilus]
MPVTAFIVEDSLAIREGLSGALSEMAGIETTGTAASEGEALRWLDEAGQPWDLAIVDLILEGQGSGLGVLRALRTRQPDQKVVVLTATASKAVREQCMALGSDEVFDKSMESDALIAWCAAFADGRRDGASGSREAGER